MDIKVLDISLRRNVVPKILKPIRHTEIDASWSAAAANAFADKDEYEFLVVKEKEKIQGLFFPVYYKEVVSSEKEQSLVMMSPEGGLAEASHPGLDMAASYFNIHPTMYLCPTGHILLTKHCDQHNVDGSEIA